jgi:hypothetical protein
MKAIILFFSILLAGFGSCSKVQASGLADLKFGAAQIADSQWNVQACTQTATCQIYSKNPGTAYKIPWTSGRLVWVAGDYVAFVTTGNTTNPWNAIQYSSNGTQKAVMGTGHIINMGSDYFFFVGNDNNTGQLFSMTQGFANTSGVTWTGTLNPSVAQVNAYAANGSTTPLAAGQTAQAPRAHFTTNSEMNVAGGGSNYAFIYQGNSSDYNVVVGIKAGDYWRCDNCSNGQTIYGRVTSVTDNNNGFFYVYMADNTGAPVLPESGKWYTYSDTSLVPVLPSYVTVGNGTQPVMNFGSNSAITIQQQTNVDLWSNRIIPDGNKIYIDQVSGNNNTVTMDQDGNKNLIRATISGNSNSITARQGVPGTGQNEIKINTVGDNNTLNINQSRTTQGTAIGTNGHYQNADINGSNNTLITQQSNSGGVGGQYMETTINGNQNSVTARQTDNGNKIMFNSITGNNNTIEAVQKGTGQHYLENKLTGNSNSVSAVQEGSTANRATLDLTNAGGPASVILQQNGGQNVTVTTSCATAGGCAPITVRQGY